MGVLALSALILAGAGFVLFAQSAPNFKPGQKKVLADLKLIRDEVLALSSDLAPIRKEDLETLSSKETGSSVKKRFVSNYKGIFVTIFDEHAVAYYCRRYLSNKSDALIFAKTTRHEFFYWLRNGVCEIMVDEQQLGKYDEASGVLAGARTSKPIARLEKKPSENSGGVLFIQDRQIARLAPPKPNAKDVLSRRVFEFVQNELSPEEEAIVLAIAILEMVRHKGVLS
ncbi:MAG: hypothetical protein ACOYOO_11065 [Saprospiraceae bacterium]